MKLLDANKVRWLGGIGLGIVADQTLRDGWGALALLALGILGRWFLGKVASTLFDDELTAAKRFFSLKDPVKQSLWSHALDGHEGNWQDCEHEVCQL